MNLLQVDLSVLEVLVGLLFPGVATADVDDRDVFCVEIFRDFQCFPVVHRSDFV